MDEQVKMYVGTEYQCTFLEPSLGTASGNAELYTDFIAAKAPPEQDTADELDALPGLISRSLSSAYFRS